jgi:hypothetical protein
VAHHFFSGFGQFRCLWFALKKPPFIHNMKVPFKGFIFTLLFCLAFSPTSVYAGAGLSLEETPSWRVILFLLAFLILSIIVEHSIHKLDHYLVHHGKLGPRAALTKIKDELMLMGFISLVLIIMEDMILAQCSDVSTAGVPVLGAKCIAELHLDGLLTGSSSGSSSSSSSSSTSGSGSRRLASKSTLAMMDYCCGVGGSSSAASSNSTSSRMLLEYSMDYVGKGNRRALGGAADDCQCPCGQTPFIEQASLHQIHVLIFAYAATHIIYGCVVMAFAQMKVSVWKEWEQWAENPGEWRWLVVGRWSMVLLANETKTVPLISLHFVSLFLFFPSPLLTPSIPFFYKNISRDPH